MMDQLILIIWILSGFIVLMFLALIIINWIEIISFLRPQNYISITMIELDGNITDDIVRKPNDFKYSYAGGTYYLFNTDYIKHYDSKEIRREGRTVYRKGRLGHYTFREGNENPIDYSTVTATGNPRMIEEMIVVIASTVNHNANTITT